MCFIKLYVGTYGNKNGIASLYVRINKFRNNKLCVEKGFQVILTLLFVLLISGLVMCCFFYRNVNVETFNAEYNSHAHFIR